jgi:hypothetical protein
MYRGAASDAPITDETLGTVEFVGTLLDITTETSRQ